VNFSSARLRVREVILKMEARLGEEVGNKTLFKVAIEELLRIPTLCVEVCALSTVVGGSRILAGGEPELPRLCSDGSLWLMMSENEAPMDVDAVGRSCQGILRLSFGEVQSQSRSRRSWNGRTTFSSPLVRWFVHL